MAADDPEYVTKTYWQFRDAKLSRKKLGALGSTLALPEGWKYRTRRIKHDLTLKTNGATTVLQDELENTYQLVK